MFEKNDKRRLYQLIDMYLTGKIDGWTFCNEFYYSYDLEIDYESLTELEYKIFSELDKVSSRYTNIEEDLKKYPETYFTEEQLHKKVIETKEKLKE